MAKPRTSQGYPFNFLIKTKIFSNKLKKKSNK